MRVLMLGWEFPPHITGGLGTACHGFVVGLGTSDTDLTFVLPRLTGDEPLVDARLVDAEGRITPTAPHRGNSPVSSYAGTDETDGVAVLSAVQDFADGVSRLAQREAPELIHAHDWMTFPAAIAASEATGAPLVLHIHSCEYDRRGPSADPRIVHIEQEAFDRADAIVCVSRYTARRLRAHYRVVADRLHVVHNAVAPPEAPQQADTAPPPEDEPPVVLFLGRAAAQKGPDVFLQAARRVVDQRDDVRFVLAGDGPLLPTLVERAAEAGLARHVRFTGFLRGDEVDEAYTRASVFVLPSVSEPFGLAPLEALSRNVPVIVSKRSGIAEVLRNVLTVDGWDVDSIADRILEVLSQPERYRADAERGAEEARALNWETQAEALRRVWQSLVPEGSE